MASTRTTIIRSSAAIAALLTASIGLTGCGVDFTPDSDDNSSSSQSAPAPTDSADATTAPKTTAPTTGANDDDDADDTNDSDDSPSEVTRDALEAAVEKNISCPGGVVDISDNGRVFDLDSDCTEVTVSGSGTSVLADDITTLRVTGTGITVFTDDLGALEVTGIGNTVEWDSGSPKVSDTGTGNVLRPATD